MKLEIVTPDQIVFSGEVELVTLPGINGLFTILENHAPIISPLTKGTLRYKTSKGEINHTITGGFVELNNNTVSVCAESISNEE